MRILDNNRMDSNTLILNSHLVIGVYVVKVWKARDGKILYGCVQNNFLKESIKFFNDQSIHFKLILKKTKLEIQL